MLTRFAIGLSILFAAPLSLAAPPATAPAAKPSGYATESHRLVSSENEVVAVLENGLTVITRRIASPVVSVRGYVRTGGAFEGKWLGGGLSHLLEHLVAGGSSAKRTEAENRDLLQRIGNNSNAYTSLDHTAYFVNTVPEHMEEAVDLVTGWMLGALITPEEYRREYEVVQRELEKDKGEPMRAFYQLTQSNRYQVSPAGVPVIGYQSVIQGLSRDDVYAYYRMAYQPNNMVFAVAGDLPPVMMLEAVKKCVDDAPPGRVFDRAVPDEPDVVAPRTAAAIFPRLGSARLQVEWPSVRLQDEEMYPLDLLAMVLGGGEASILTEELRDKQQLVNVVMVGDMTPHWVAGSFEVHMDLPPEKLTQAQAALAAIVEQVKQTPIDEQRIARAKVQLRASRVKNQQTAEDIAASLATDYMSAGDAHFSDAYLKRIEKVTAEDMQRVARKYLVPEKRIATAMLPAEFVGKGGLAKAEQLLRASSPTTQPAASQPASPVSSSVLPDGTTLLHRRITSSPVVVMNLYSLGGLTAEDGKTNGIGNLAMESVNRGTEKMTAQQIAEFFDSTGGDFDAACGNNTWYWNATCLKENFPRTFEVYAQLVKSPAFKEDEVKQVRMRTLARIEGVDSDWNGLAMRFFKKAYFGPSKSPYQFLTMGGKENVGRLTADELRKWYGEKVLKGRKVLAVFGDVSLEDARRAAEEAFGADSPTAVKPGPVSAPTEQAAEAVERIAKPSVRVERVEVEKSELPVAGVVIGFDSHSIIGDADTFALDVGDTMASGWGYPTGYLHEILRGRGLVYVVAVQAMPGRSEKYPGTFIVYAGCEPAKVNEVVETAIENIARLQGSEAEMNGQWFARSKQLITTSEAMERETPAQQASSAALDELYGLGFDYRDKFNERIEAVTLDAVRGVAAAKLKACVVTVTTPKPELVKVRTGERLYQSFPPVDLTPKGVGHGAPGGH